MPGKQKCRILKEIAAGVRVAVVHESPFRIIELTEALAENLPEAESSAIIADRRSGHSVARTAEQRLR